MMTSNQINYVYMNTYHEIEATDLAKLMSENKLTLIDVRNDDEVARGIIENATHLPLALLPTQYEPLLKTETLVFYCHSGVRSAHAAAFIASKGHHKAYNLIGGVLAWQRAGFSFVSQS
jgi:rhodanese-related sulfurtransferase